MKMLLLLALVPAIAYAEDDHLIMDCGQHSAIGWDGYLAGFNERPDGSGGEIHFDVERTYALGEADHIFKDGMEKQQHWRISIYRPGMPERIMPFVGNVVRVWTAQAYTITLQCGAP